MKNVGAFAIDVLLVLVYSLASRASHDEPITLLGLGYTAWPFIIGLALGWVLTRSWRSTLTLPAAFGVWFFTVFGGFTTRFLVGGTLHLTFLMVTFFVLAYLLMGWRLMAFLIVSTRQRKRDAELAADQAVSN